MAPVQNFNFLVHKFSLEGHVSYYDVMNEDVKNLKTHRLRFILMASPLVFDISPNLVKDLQGLIEQVEYYYIVSEARVFRPMEFPGGRGRSGVKQRNVIRQWFEYVVWSLRVRKAL